MRYTLNFLSALALAMLHCRTQAESFPTNTAPDLERTCFQTGKPWSPKADIGSDVAIVYGIDTNLPSRIESWREHGYRVQVMTGVAWGKYQDYLYGRFDGTNHEDEAQTEKDGRKIGHGGDVYYMSPGIQYGKFLSVGVQRAIDAGAEAIHLEEPEFWDRAGYSDGFKREWKAYYHEDWQAPDSSVDARWKAGKLKYFLYRRTLQQVFDYIHDYNERTHRNIHCYVATHSLPNYAQWCIVSPESSLAQLRGCDGYIAQVWTGTAREPNRYHGEVRSRTFETAFLEYGAMQNLVRSTGRKVWYLNDPIEDNPGYDWNDYRTNWESTLTASLFQPEVSQYEVAPWPERVFNGRYPHSARKSEQKTIPADYATELQTVFHALNDMKQSRVEWDCGTPGIGVIVSDSLMFQRGQPTPSDPHLGNFYGLAMPLVKHGIPATPVQLENVGVSHYLDPFKVLFLSYDGQKPLTAAVHQPLADWVRRGGVLIVCDKDGDPYLSVSDWWNSDGNHLATPRAHLFAELGIDDALPAETFHSIEKGGVIWIKHRPVDGSTSVAGADRIIAMAKLACEKSGIAWRLSNHLWLRRGPYIIAAGLDDSIGGAAQTMKGHFVSLFDAKLRVQEEIVINPLTRWFLCDLDTARNGTTHLLAAACKTTEEKTTDAEVVFQIEGAAKTQGVLLLESASAPKAVTLDGKELPTFDYSVKEKLLWVRFENSATPRKLAMQF